MHDPHRDPRCCCSLPSDNHVVLKRTFWNQIHLVTTGDGLGLDLPEEMCQRMAACTTKHAVWALMQWIDGLVRYPCIACLATLITL